MTRHNALLITAGAVSIITILIPPTLAAFGVIGYLKIGGPAETVFTPDLLRKLRHRNPHVSRLVEKISSSGDIRSKYWNVRCTRKFLGDDEIWRLKTQQNESTDNGPQTNLDGDVNSCLIIENHSHSQYFGWWSGDFKLVWTIDNESEAVVISFVARADDGKISMNASGYLLTKEKEKWYISHQKENITKEAKNEGELTGKFPEWGDGLIPSFNMKRWGWENRFEDICYWNWCKVTPSSSYPDQWWAWVWETKNKEEEKETETPKGTEDTNGASGTQGKKAEEVKEIHKWNKNFDTWFNNFFPEWTSVKDKLKQLKGIWKREFFNSY